MSDGVPSYDTLGRVFSRIRPKQFTQCFIEWVQSFIEQHNDVDEEKLSVIAFDGKTARRSHDRSNSKSAMHMMNVWCCASQLVLDRSEWASLNSIVRIDRIRTADDKTSYETHYYICSSN
ncbi:ISAs1 family transposase [Pelagibaculum spongiae]|uniref:ISAs1 family transposase n=1 Tax=Pelagibaculum spongiae TaxID=2080658 RepID=A0A2V1H5H4_9GAMM|nr:ISAs1 family transposase [Pelagibaculum spongiae]